MLVGYRQEPRQDIDIVPHDVSPGKDIDSSMLT